ncbi:hypothetical protein JRO89_XS04G0143200 [Xanthoceras sorbifolium]|uniref:Uncharacterized protein n=1 Tax=Xanthoceras sorbifolium TaxID=99658 RepID=A0ABQ8I5R1_9ROSI|nr:hypothetical protein JRO89_XS04G0143200 [Xanthoceras sorbifolium]
MHTSLSLRMIYKRRETAIHILICKRQKADMLQAICQHEGIRNEGCIFGIESTKAPLTNRKKSIHMTCLLFDTTR